MGEQWRREMAGTAPADRISTEAALADMYRLLGHRPPRIDWVDSPWAAVARVLELGDEGGEWLTVPETESWTLAVFDSAGAHRLHDRLEWLLDEYMSATAICTIADPL